MFDSKLGSPSYFTILKPSHEKLTNLLQQDLVNTFASAFDLLQGQKLQAREVKVFMAESFMKSVNSRIKEDTTSQSLTSANASLQDALEYLSLKYVQVSAKSLHSAAVKQIDNSESLDNNYLFNSDVVFDYREEANYNDLIMRLINEIASRTTDASVLETFKEASLHGPITSRIPKDFTPFTQKQINNHDLTLKHPSILQILIEWNIELRQKFNIKNYFSRKAENTHLPHCKKINNLQHWMKAQLDEEIQKETPQVNSLIKQLKTQFAQTVFQAFRNAEKINLTPLMAEIQMGKIAYSFVMKLGEITVRQTNGLIHGLLATSYRFFNRQGLSKSAWPQPPNVITLKIPNLLSLPNFTSFTGVVPQYQNWKKEELCIVKLQKRLSTSWRDIVIHVKIRNKIIAEINCVPSSQLSTFEASSNYFHSFIRELQANSYGLIVALSLRWVIDEKRMNYYKKFYLHEKKDKSAQLEDAQSVMGKLGGQIAAKVGRRITEVDEQFPEYGVCLFKNPQNSTKKAQPQLFRFYEDAETNYLVGRNVSGCYLIDDLNSKESAFNFIDSHYVFGLKDAVELVNISQADIKSAFLLSKYVRHCYAKSKETISLINNGLSDEACMKILLGPKQEKTSVKNLFLTDNKVTRVDYYCKEYPNLQWLELNRTQMKDYTGINHLSKLKILILDKCPLVTIPIDVCKLNNLEVITISQSQITYLPDEVLNWKSLKHIEIDFNALESLPQAFMHCIKLQTLNVDGNKIKALPNSIHQLKSLNRLFVSSNQITSLPKGLFQLNKLTELHIKNNQLTALDAGIKALANLKVLDVSGNKIQELPLQLCELNLTKFNASSNKLKTIPKELSKWKEISSLDLSKNEATLSQVGCLQWLVSLHFEQNRELCEKFQQK